MEISLYSKCSECEQEPISVVMIQDKSGYGDWISLCINCLQSATKMLEPNNVNAPNIIKERKQ